jgi:hypothetical protein
MVTVGAMIGTKEIDGVLMGQAAIAITRSTSTRRFSGQWGNDEQGNESYWMTAEFEIGQ